MLTTIDALPVGTRPVGATERVVLVAALEIAADRWAAESAAAGVAGNLHNEIVYQMQANDADLLAAMFRDSDTVLLVDHR